MKDKEIPILHIFNDQKKFSKPFFDFLQENKFDLSKHYLFHYGKTDRSYSKYGMIGYKFAGSFFSIMPNIKLLFLLFKSNKVIVHSLAAPALLLYLYFFPSLCKKIYWVIWGKDLYFYRELKHPKFYHKIYEILRIQVIKKIEHFITYIKGDYELAQKWYRAKGKYHECFMYPSNLYKEYEIKPKIHDTINILLGNSADPTNNHMEVLEKFTKYKNENIYIYTPLSYGDKEYAKKVISYGKELFRDRFIPLTEFMPFERYLEFLGEIDIAVFAHKRQQAMGNTITLLGLGKKVYMRSNTTQWRLFKNLGVKVYNIDNFNIKLIDEETKKINQKIIKEYFSKENYLKQLKELFGG